jgi:hypothetical protein
MVYFSGPRRRGNPETATDSAGNRRTGRTGPTGRPAGKVDPKSSGDRRRKVRSEIGRGSFGIVERSRTTASREAGHGGPRGRSRTGREAGPCGQVVRPTPVILTNHAAVGFVPLQADRSWVPGPATNGQRTPRGLKLRLKLPRGFSRSGSPALFTTVRLGA